MTEVILTTCEFVKGLLNVSDNLSAKYLRPAIDEAQEIGLRTILGDKLLDKLKEIVRDNLGGGSFSPESFDASFETEHPEFAKYIALLKRPEFQYYLAYSAAALVIPKVSYKIANAGVVRSTDEHVVAPSFEEVKATQADYQGKADFFCRRLQGNRRDNRLRHPLQPLLRRHLRHLPGRGERTRGGLRRLRPPQPTRPETMTLLDLITTIEREASRQPAVRTIVRQDG